MEAQLVLVALLATAFVAVVVLAVSLRAGSEPGALSLSALMGAIAWWTLSYAAELAVSGVEAKAVLSTLGWPAVLTVPVAWVVFALSYTGHDEYLTPGTVLTLASVPVALLVVAATNGIHGLMWTDVTVVQQNGLGVLEKDLAVGFWVAMAYTYIHGLVGAVILLGFALRQRSIYRKQSVAVLVASVSPLVVNVLYVSGLLDTGAISPTPFAFAISGTALLYAVSGEGLFDRTPVPDHVAREAVVDGMDDAVFVLDSDGRVVDVNDAAADLLAEARGTDATGDERGGVDTGHQSVLGDPASEVLPFPSADPGESERPGGEVVTVGVGDGERYYDVAASTLRDQFDREVGRVVTLRDVTQRRRQRERVDTLNRLLRRSLETGMDTVLEHADDGDADDDTDLAAAVESLGAGERIEEIEALVEGPRDEAVDLVPIVQRELDVARERHPEIEFSVSAPLTDWVHCDGIVEPVVRIVIRSAAARATGPEPAVRVDIGVGSRPVGDTEVGAVSDGGRIEDRGAGDGTIVVGVAHTGPALPDAARRVLTEGADPDPEDPEDVGRWLVNWGIGQLGGTVGVDHAGGETTVELRIPRGDHGE